MENKYRYIPPPQLTKPVWPEKVNMLFLILFAVCIVYFCYVLTMLSRKSRAWRSALVLHSLYYAFRWLTHLCMWNPVPGVTAAAAGRSPAWQLGPGGWGGRRKDPNTIHGEPLLWTVVFQIYSIIALSLEGVAPERYQGNQGCLDSSQGPAPVLIPWPVRVGWLQWPSGRHHPDKGERHR